MVRGRRLAGLQLLRRGGGRAGRGQFLHPRGRFALHGWEVHEVLDRRHHALSQRALYKGFGPNSAHHFTYDVYFYLTNPNFSEALEFDLNQYIGGKQYIFGHQCSPKWSKTWDTWNQSTGHWESTGIPCPVFSAYKWNHVVIEVERTGDNQLHYVAITYNGVKSYVNRYRAPTGTAWNGFSVDFQMDGDYAQNDYATWLDKMNINYW